MRAWSFVFAALLLGAGTAEAGREVGVITFGDAATTGPLVRRVESWLRGHGHEIVANPLAAEAVILVRDCLIVDDQTCARDVIAQQARAESVLVARAEPGAKGEIALNLYWFVKAQPPVAERRVCEACTDERLATLADGMLGRLAAGRTDLGKLKLQTSPPGLTVRLDGAVIGVTPIERDLPPGEHRIVLERASAAVDRRTIQITTGETATIDVSLDDARRASRLLPLTLMAVGLGGVAAGATFYYYGTKRGADEMYIYDDTRALGGVIGAVGVGAIVAGVLLLRRSGEASRPVAAVTSEGGYVGWAGRF